MTEKFWRILINLVAVLGLLFIGLSLTGCGEGIPKGIKQKAKNIPATIKTAADSIAQEQKKYKKLTGSAPFKPIAPFAKKENWPDKFVSANQMLDRATDLFKKDLEPLLKKNKPESVPQIQKQIHRITRVIHDARVLSQAPAMRFKNISHAIANADQFSSDAKNRTQKIHAIVGRLQSDLFTKALADFPDNKAGINARLAPFLDVDRQSGTHLKIVDKQYRLLKAGSNTDYAAFTDSGMAIAKNLEETKKLSETTQQEIGQLYLSYTKVLKDMKVNYQVTIKRESWNENSDFYDPAFTSFTREVPPDVFDALTADNIDSIGEIKAGYSGSRFSSRVGNTWNKLGITPGENWPSGRRHNAASFWVEDAKETYFHKYVLETDGKTRETDWQKVDESFYDANLEFLGMAILAKPLGTFEKDRLTQASPPGMAYVGNSQYGEWKENESGDRFWSWYGRYAFFSHLFFFPPYYYGYNSWHGWHNNYRHKKPYFGKTKKGFQKFGTNGTVVRQSPKFQNSTFAKSGGFKSQVSSVRGAGAGLRGGGPKGKGK